MARGKAKRKTEYRLSLKEKELIYLKGLTQNGPAEEDEGHKKIRVGLFLLSMEMLEKGGCKE